MKQTTDHMPVQPTHHQPSHQHSFRCNCSMSSSNKLHSFSHSFWIQLSSPHFPMTPEALLQFQQPQFLFPFYIPGAEFNISPELALHSAFGMPGITGSFLEDLKQQMQQQHQLGQQQQLQLSQQQAQQQASQSQMQQQKAQQQSHKPKAESNHIALSEIQCPEMLKST